MLDVEIRCYRCGGVMQPIIYPTNPPKSGVRCVNCGREDRDEPISWSGNGTGKQIIYR